MVTSIFIALLTPVALAFAFRSPKDDELIAKRPYNNPYNAATGARDGKLG